jgi:hypothetical protein
MTNETTSCNGRKNGAGKIRLNSRCHWHGSVTMTMALTVIATVVVPGSQTTVTVPEDYSKSAELAASLYNIRDVSSRVRGVHDISPTIHCRIIDKIRQREADGALPYFSHHARSKMLKTFIVASKEWPSKVGNTSSMRSHEMVSAYLARIDL